MTKYHLATKISALTRFGSLTAFTAWGSIIITYCTKIEGNETSLKIEAFKAILCRSVGKRSTRRKNVPKLSEQFNSVRDLCVRISEI